MKGSTESSSHQDDLCDVCSRGIVVKVVSSGIAPVSGGVCKQCFSQGTENINVVFTWVCLNGGLEAVPDFSLQITSYDQGKYIDWPQIAELYRENKTEIEVRVRSEFTPSEDETFYSDPDAVELDFEDDPLPEEDDKE
jgi:hypothetical protein